MARANGKVILFGEHAVVYGVPALAAGIDRGAVAASRPAEAASLALGERVVRPGDGSELGAAYSALLEVCDAPPLATEVTVEVPPGCGLGASAAMGVAVARAVREATAEAKGTSPHAGNPDDANPTEDDDSLAATLAAADAWERVFHGNPSGVDAAAAAHGGTILYSREDGPSPIFLQRQLTLAVAIAGPPAPTKDMVASVAALKARRPEIVEKALVGVHSIVRNAVLLLRAGDLPGLGKLMDLNHMLLSGLFLSTEDIEQACTVARAAGALGAKLTGAGGGGAVIALADDPEPILASWRDAGFDGFATTVTPHHPPPCGEHHP